MSVKIKHKSWSFILRRITLTGSLLLFCYCSEQLGGREANLLFAGHLCRTPAFPRKRRSDANEKNNSKQTDHSDSLRGFFLASVVVTSTFSSLENGSDCFVFLLATWSKVNIRAVHQAQSPWKLINGINSCPALCSKLAASQAFLKNIFFLSSSLFGNWLANQNAN